MKQILSLERKVLGNLENKYDINNIIQIRLNSNIGKTLGEVEKSTLCQFHVFCDRTYWQYEYNIIIFYVQQFGGLSFDVYDNNNNMFIKLLSYCLSVPCDHI